MIGDLTGHEEIAAVLRAALVGVAQRFTLTESHETMATFDVTVGAAAYSVTVRRLPPRENMLAPPRER